MNTTITVRKAQRQKSKLRLALIGPSGTGKTYSSLQIAKGLGEKILLVDTEGGSGELYAHLFDYDVATLSAPFLPEKYIDYIKYAEENAYDVVILDSLSHAWVGEGGLLDQQGKIADSGKGNSYTAWRTITPQHNQLVESILQAKVHVIGTVRAKTEYVLQDDEKGRSVPKKVGMAPIQRDGLEYEFTVVFDIDYNHQVSASKDRTGLFDRRYVKATPELGKEIKDWLELGVEPIDALIAEISTATSNRCAEIYKNNEQFRNNGKFMAALATRKKELEEEKNKGREADSVEPPVEVTKEEEDMTTKFMNSLDEPSPIESHEELMARAMKEVEQAKSQEELDKIKTKYTKLSNVADFNMESSSFQQHTQVDCV
jgi:hypothetical protein